MNTLFSDLKDRYIKYNLPDHQNGLIYDGIIDPVRFSNQEHKILFIAKEHNHLNDTYESGSYADWWKLHVKYAFSHRISEWAYGIQNDFPDYASIEDVHKHEALQSIAFINLKKTYGGNSSDMMVLADYVDKSKDLLRQQIRSISPTVIICCLRYDYLPKKLFGFDSMIPFQNNMLSYQFWQDDGNNHLVLNFFHPSARKNKKLLYDQLKELINFAIPTTLCQLT